MKRRLLIPALAGLLLWLQPVMAGAADLSGRYLAPGPSGEISLALELEEDGVLRGAMSDGATTFQVAGRVEERTLSGQAFNDGELLGLLAILDESGEWLAVALIPYDTNREPLPALAETLAFRRTP